MFRSTLLFAIACAAGCVGSSSAAPALGSPSTGQTTQADTGMCAGWTSDGTTTSSGQFVSIGAQSGDAYPLQVNGPTYIMATATASNNGEIVRVHVDGDGTPRQTGDGDIAAVVAGVEDTMQFDTTNGANTAISIYGRTNATHVAGTPNLTNVGCSCGATNGDQNWSVFTGPGLGVANFYDGIQSGPVVIDGAFTQSGGAFSIAGGATVNGDWHIQGHNLLVDGALEAGGAVQFDSSIRVNGNVNLDGGAAQIYIPAVVNTSGHGAQFTDVIGIGGTGGPRWSSGSSAPTGSLNPCNIGDLYSNTSGSPYALYVCTSSGVWTGK